MKQKESKNILIFRVLLLVGCLSGIGLWLMNGSIGGAPMALQGTMSLAYAESGKQSVLPEMDLHVPENTEIALFALGWFWGIDSQFGSMQGVYRTSAGYAGGSDPNPSYRQMKDYSETVLVEFSPQEISYRQLLDVFWNSHDPTYEIYSRQYHNAIFYLSEDQRLQAEQSRELLRQAKNQPVYTAIEKAGDYYQAEDYHQKYYLRGADKLIDEFARMYPEVNQLVASTAAARINGYLGCNGEAENLKKEISLLGLSSAAQEYLVSHVAAACKRFEGLTCPAPKKK